MRRVLLFASAALLALLALITRLPVAAAALGTFQYQGAIPHDVLNGMVETTDLVTDLRNFTGTYYTSGNLNTRSQVYARGLTAVGDGFGGAYYWNPTSTASDDGFTVIKPAAVSGAGRWLRQVANPVEAPAMAGGGAVVKIMPPNTAFGSAPAFGNYLIPWVVLRPDGGKEVCTPTIDNCLDRVFADPSISNNWSYEIDGGGGLYGSNNALAIGGSQTWPTLRNKTFTARALGVYGTAQTDALDLVVLDGSIESETRFIGGQIVAGPNAIYSDATVLLKPQTALPVEGFSAVSTATIELSNLGHDLPPASAVTTGSISGTTLTVASGAGIAAGQIVMGSGVLQNTRVTGVIGGSGGTSWTVACGLNTACSQTVTGQVLSFYPTANSTLHVSTTAGNVIAAIIKGIEVNGAGSGAQGDANQAILIDGATATTGLQDTDIAVAYVHNFVTVGIQDGTGTATPNNMHGGTFNFPQVSPLNGAEGVNTFGAGRHWNVEVDTNSLGEAGDTVFIGFLFEPGANNNVADIRCRAGNAAVTISTCVKFAAGSAGNIARIWTYTTGSGAIATPYADLSAGANTIYLNGKLVVSPWQGVTGSLGGSALAAGQCSSTTVTIAGVTLGMAATIAPAADPGDNFVAKAFPSGANTVTAKVCAIAAGTPAATTYNVRVQP